MSQTLRYSAILAMVGSTLWVASAAADGWPVAHGNPGNTSYQNVVTAPAQTPQRIMGELGRFADGIVPIVSAEGNVFLGTLEGKVIALRSDGTPWWEYQIPSGFAVRSTPAVTSRGELFVLASRNVTDHRDGAEVKRIETQLLAFAEGGALLYNVTVPPRGSRGGLSTAPLNILRGPADTEHVVFPMRYIFSEGYYQQLWIMAYNRFGLIEAEVKVGDEHGTMSGESGIAFGHGFNIPGDPSLPPLFQPPLFGVAVPHGNGLDSSVVVVNDDMGSVARYRFTGRFAEGFVEIDRWKQGERDPATSAPVVALNGAVLFGRPRDVLILQTDGTDQQRAVRNQGDVAPAVLPNGRILHRSLQALQEAGIDTVMRTNQSSISPTASRTYLYASEYTRFSTYRLDDLSVVATYEWENGGRNQPAIGPLGHIYALNHDKLYIFPPDRSVATGTNIGPGGVAGASTNPSGGASSGAPAQPTTGGFDPLIVTRPRDLVVPTN